MSQSKPLGRTLEEFTIPEPNSGCLLWTGARDRSGYGYMMRGRPPSTRTTRAHRLSYELAVGPIPPGLLVCHKCDVRICCEPSHLFLGSIADNMADRDRKGRQARGERSGKAKISATAAAEIKHVLSTGEMQSKIADRLGVSRSSVQDIRRGHTWRHIPVEPHGAAAPSQ